MSLFEAKVNRWGEKWREEEGGGREMKGESSPTETKSSLRKPQCNGGESAPGQNPPSLREGSRTPYLTEQFIIRTAVAVELSISHTVIL